MKKIITSAIVTVAAFTVVTSPASANTTWKTFEAEGHTVKARYQHGELRHIKAVNKATGEVYSGRISSDGIAYINRPDASVARIDINAAEKRLNSTTTMQDLAQSN